jgi:Holliday junction resolvase-like predicted endonuclease
VIYAHHQYYLDDGLNSRIDVVYFDTGLSISDWNNGQLDLSSLSDIRLDVAISKAALLAGLNQSVGNFKDMPLNEALGATMGVTAPSAVKVSGAAMVGFTKKFADGFDTAFPFSSSAMRGARKVNGKIIVDNIGEYGEYLADVHLRKNGFTEFKYFKNSRNNGIDIIAKGKDGKWVAFEVKTTSVGEWIPDASWLSPRQAKGWEWFTKNVLNDIAAKQGRYKNVSQKMADEAKLLLRDLKQGKFAPGQMVGVNLKTNRLVIVPW